MKQFDFGQNWTQFANKAMSKSKADKARKDFFSLLDEIVLADCWFLDIGFGQGLSMMCAAELGAQVVGLDINKKNLDALLLTAKWFPTVEQNKMVIQFGSILSKAVSTELAQLRPRGYDVIHAWGVLHHTGNMRMALRACTKLLKPGGYLIVSIYNHHWSSPIWRVIKRFYCHSPNVTKKLIVYCMYPIIWIAKLIVTGQSPSRKERGMDFFTDVVDWVGGYPYEYASIERFNRMCHKESLTPVRTIPANVPTGCNEFIFRKTHS